MRRNFIAVFAILVLAVFVTVLIAGEEHSYVGAKKCIMCHKGEKKFNVSEKWEASKHANATAQLEGQEVTGECYSCHATGHGAGGYNPAAEDPAVFAGVQCEACHGPGSDYKKMSIMKDREQAVANGLVIPTPEHCTTCHNTSHHEDMVFNYDEAWPQIAHPIERGE